MLFNPLPNKLRTTDKNANSRQNGSPPTNRRHHDCFLHYLYSLWLKSKHPCLCAEKKLLIWSLTLMFQKQFSLRPLSYWKPLSRSTSSNVWLESSKLFLQPQTAPDIKNSWLFISSRSATVDSGDALFCSLPAAVFLPSLHCGHPLPKTTTRNL